MTASPISDLNPILMAARCTLTLASSHGKWDKFFAVLDIKAFPKEMASTPLQLPLRDLCKSLSCELYMQLLKLSGKLLNL